MPKAKLLNREQRKLLEERVRVAMHEHRGKLGAQESAEPPEIRRARKLIDRWEASQRKHETRLRGELTAHERMVRYTMAFGSVEEALKAVDEFERLKLREVA